MAEWLNLANEMKAKEFGGTFLKEDGSVKG